MHPRPLLPNRTPALHNRDQLLRDPLSKATAAATARLALARRVQDPHERGAPALAHAERDGDLERDTTAGGAALGADAQEGGYAVEGES